MDDISKKFDDLGYDLFGMDNIVYLSNVEPMQECPLECKTCKKGCSTCNPGCGDGPR